MAFLRQCSPSFLLLGLVLLSLSQRAVCAADVPRVDLEDFRAQHPGILTPGTTQLVADWATPGYFTCTLVLRYFDDETMADLSAELDLSARQQFLRFLLAGREDGGARPATVTVTGFQNCGVWWDETSLCGLYFVPLAGVADVAGEQAGVTSSARGGVTPTELLLEGRAMRKRGEFDAARAVFARLRREFPLSAEARRALREIYFVNTAESKNAAGKGGG